MGGDATYTTVRIVTLTMGVVAVLHFAATTFGRGLFFTSGSIQSSHTTNVAALLQTRATLVQEIAELRHIVLQLDKVDITSGLVVAPSLALQPPRPRLSRPQQPAAVLARRRLFFGKSRPACHLQNPLPPVPS